MDIRLEKMGLDPEKLRELLERQHQEYAASTTQPEAAGSSDAPRTSPTPSERLRFDLKPEELISYLDDYVIRQDAAKAILATKICTHFNRLRLPEEEEDLVGSIKNNILMIGPTGVGKTFIIKLIARRLGVPFVKADATKFSETGYVGGDVEDLVRELVAEADGDIELAQHGIIYIDEIDKIASSHNTTGPDVSRSGVQRNLLKLMEETDVDLKAPNDISSQMESVIQLQKTGKVERQKINTRNILFVVSGAFGDLEDIIARRLNRGRMGFALTSPATGQDKGVDEEEGNLLISVRAEDLIEYGFESEFIGRLPVVAVLDELSRDDLLQILRNPRSSVILSKKRDFKAYDIDLTFADEALALLAARAHEEHTGARGLVSAIEKALLGFERKLPSFAIEALTVDDRLVREPEEELRRLLVDESVKAFIDSFLTDHGIALRLDATATAAATEMAAERGELPGDTCRRALSDYGHGLKLLELEEFVVTADVLRDPQAALNRLIKSRFGAETP